LGVRGLPIGEDARVAALPERCPRCELTIGPNLDREIFFRATVLTPIRAHTGGLAQATQLLLSQLFSAVGDDAATSRTIVFTDSRDDAARTAAGVGLNAFRDLVRLLIRQEVDQEVSPSALLRRGAADESALSDRERLEYGRLQELHPREAIAYVRQELGRAAETDLVLLASFEAAFPPNVAQVSWGAALQRLTDRLVALGVNPAGPLASERELPSGDPWYVAHEPPEPGMWPVAPPEVRREGRREHLAALGASLSEAIFDRAGRDIESIRLGIVDAPAVRVDPLGLGIDSRDALRSVIRLLGLLGRYDGSRRAGPRDERTPPRAVRQYLERVADAHGVARGDLVEAMAAVVLDGRIAPSWLLATRTAESPLSLIGPSGPTEWICRRCANVHLHASA
jgi:DEAD/DEAH box helicase domain-containing protein